MKGKTGERCFERWEVWWRGEGGGEFVVEAVKMS